MNDCSGGKCTAQEKKRRRGGRGEEEEKRRKVGRGRTGQEAPEYMSRHQQAALKSFQQDKTTPPQANVNHLWAASLAVEWNKCGSASRYSTE